MARPKTLRGPCFVQVRPPSRLPSTSLGPRPTASQALGRRAGDAAERGVAVRDVVASPGHAAVRRPGRPADLPASAVDRVVRYRDAHLRRRAGHRGRERHHLRQMNARPTLAAVDGAQRDAAEVGTAEVADDLADGRGQAVDPVDHAHGREDLVVPRPSAVDRPHDDAAVAARDTEVRSRAPDGEEHAAGQRCRREVPGQSAVHRAVDRAGVTEAAAGDQTSLRRPARDGGQRLDARRRRQHRPGRARVGRGNDRRLCRADPHPRPCSWRSSDS